MNADALPVILIGPMGVGKTTIGKKLARSLNVPFVDTDAVVVNRHGSIESIFKQQGERQFREFESDALIEALQSGGVVATGGGIILSDRNRALLTGQNVFYLSTDGKHQASRLQGGKRPLLKNGLDDWRRIYEERKPLYEATAKHTIDTSSAGLREIVQKIEGLL